MKKIIAILILMVPLLSKGTVWTSTSTGGNWSSSTTWTAGSGSPGTTDTVIIATTGSHYVTVNTATSINKVTVNSGAELIIGTLTVAKILVNNGSMSAGGYSYLIFTGSGTVVSGGGSWSAFTSYIKFQGSNQVIDASVTLNCGEISLDCNGLGGNVKVTNNGSVTTTNQGITNSSGTYSSTWVNAANSYVSVTYPSWTTSKDTLYASATGNTVVFGGTFGGTTGSLKSPVNNTFYNLTISTGPPLTMPNSYHCNNVTVSSGDTLNMAGDSLYLTGTWSHPGVVINHSITQIDTSVIKVSGTIVQKIPPAGYKITSTNTGGEWNYPSTWVGHIIPGIMDTVVINTTGSSYVYTYAPVTPTVVNMIVNSGATMYIYGEDLIVQKLLTNNGAMEGSTPLILTANSGTVIKGSGSWSTYSGLIYFRGSNQTIDASAVINCSHIDLDTQGLGGYVKVTNNGSVTTTSTTYGILNSGSTYSTTWVNASSSSLSVAAASWTTTKDTLYANATGNTITYTGSFNYTLKAPKTNYYNLTVNSSNIITLPSAIIVSNNLTISGGTLACSKYQITGNTSGTFSMASGATLTIGSTTIATNVSFPFKFTSAHISLNSNSTVTYQADVASQTISDTATYGNLTLSTGTTSSNKNPSGSPLNVAGNLTINASTTLPETTYTLNVTGSTTINGTLSFTSGAYNFGGSFSNNGVFTYGTSTSTFNGTSNQTIGGSNSTTFYNLTGSTTGSETVTLADNETVSNTFAISAGTITLAGTGDTLKVDGNITNSATLNATSGAVETNGSGAQTLTGSATTTFYNLIIGTVSNTTTLAGNIAVSATLTINSGSTLNAASYTITEAGNFTNNGTFTYGTSTLTLNGTSGQSLGGSPTTFYNLTGSSSGTETVTLAANETVSNNVTISSGTYTWSGAYTLNVHGNFTNNASFTAVQGIIIMNGGGTQTIGGSSSSIFNLLTCNGATVDLGNNETINGSLTISSGTLDVTASNWGLTIGVNFTANSTFNAENGTVTFNGPSNQAISGTPYPTFYNVIVSGSGGQIVTLGANQTVSNNLTITSGSLDVTTSIYTLTIGGAFAMNGGSFVPRTGTVYMTGSSSTLGGTSPLTLNNLVISSGATTLAGNITLNGNLTINSGTSLDANSTGNYSITIAGNWTDNGTFYARNGTVNFDATGRQCVTTSETFKNMTISGVSILGTSSTISITGTITIIPGGQMACNC